MNYDITFCSRMCENMECERNEKHIKGSGRLVSMTSFEDCANYINEADED